MLIFLSLKGSTVLINHEIKNGRHRTRFCGRDSESAHRMHFLRLMGEDWGEFRNGMYVEGRRRH